MTRTAWAGDPPASLRAPVCRRTGCSAPAGPEALCAEHQARQLAVRTAALARPGPGAGTPVPSWLATLATRDEPWRRRSACSGMTAVMFPEVPNRPADYRFALAICATCPVVEPCAAAGAREPVGVWGGLTPVRRRPRRRVA